MAGGDGRLFNSGKLPQQNAEQVVAAGTAYSPTSEAKRIFDFLCTFSEQLNLPTELNELAKNLQFTSEHDTIYFPIPFKETETVAALKGIEALVAAALANLKYGQQKRKVEINLEQTTCFLFQTYLSSIDGLGKYDPGIKPKLKSESTLFI